MITTGEQPPPRYKYLTEHLPSSINTPGKSRALSAKITARTQAMRIGFLSMKALGSDTVAAEISRSQWLGRDQERAALSLQNPSSDPQPWAC